MSLVMDDLVNYCTSLLILPTELLVMILSYLSIHDIVSMQFASQRFKEISETPSLWKKFVWADYEPRHKQLLEVTTASVKKLIIKIDLSYCQGTVVLDVFKKLLKNANHPLPSVINILMYEGDVDELMYSFVLESWQASSYTIGIIRNWLV